MAEYGYETDTYTGGYMPGGTWGDAQNAATQGFDLSKYLGGGSFEGMFQQGAIFGKGGGLGGAGAIGQVGQGVAQIGSGIGSIFSGMAQAKLQRERGLMQQQRAEFNAKMMELEAKSTMMAASEQGKQIQEAAGRIVGQQKAGYAAQGVNVASGVAHQMEQQTRTYAKNDVIALMANARNAAWGKSVSAWDARTQGRMAKRASEFAANSTILTSVGRSVSDIGEGTMKVVQAIAGAGG